MSISKYLSKLKTELEAEGKTLSTEAEEELHKFYAWLHPIPTTVAATTTTEVAVLATTQVEALPTAPAASGGAVSST